LNLQARADDVGPGLLFCALATRRAVRSSIDADVVSEYLQRKLDVARAGG